MITVTEAGAEQIKRFLENRGGGVGIRVTVGTSGCSGLAHKLEFVDNVNPEDLEFESLGIKIVTDPLSLPYINGTEIDFENVGMSSGFKFNNPNVKNECGCGESFTV